MPAIEGGMLSSLIEALQALLVVIYFVLVLQRIPVWNPFHLLGPDDTPSAPTSFFTGLTAHGNSLLEVQRAVQLTQLYSSVVHRPWRHQSSWTTGSGPRSAALLQQTRLLPRRRIPYEPMPS